MFMVICGKNYRHLVLKAIAASATSEASSSVHPPPPPHQCTAPESDQNKVNTRNRKQKSHSHGRHHPPPPTPPKPPHRAERQMQVQAGMCRKSRVGKNIVKTDAKCDTHTHTQENIEKKNAKCRAQHVFAQCSPPAGALFCYKTPQKPMRKQKQSSIAGEQSAKTRVSAHASKGIAPPRAAANATAANYNCKHRRTKTGAVAAA